MEKRKRITNESQSSKEAKVGEKITYGDNKKIFLDETTKVLECCPDEHQIKEFADNGQNLFVAITTDSDNDDVTTDCNDDIIHDKGCIKKLDLETLELKLVTRKAKIPAIEIMKVINDSTLALLTFGEDIILYDTRSNKTETKLSGCEYLTIDRKNNCVATLMNNRRALHIYNFTTEKPEKIDLQSGNMRLSSPSYSPDNKYLACIGCNKTNTNRKYVLYIYDIVKKKIEKSGIFNNPKTDSKLLGLYRDPLEVLEWSPDSNKLIFLTEYALVLWHRKNNTFFRNAAMEGDHFGEGIAWNKNSNIFCYSYHHYGERLIFCDINEKIQEIRSQELENTLVNYDGIKKIIWKDNQTIVSTYNYDSGLLRTFIPIDVDLHIKKQKQEKNNLEVLKTSLYNKMLTDVIFDQQ